MVNRRLPRIGATSAVVCMLLLAACTGDDGTSQDAAPPAGEPGVVAADTCFGGETLSDADALDLLGEIDSTEIAAVRDLPTYDDPVACSEPHRLEVYAVVDAPKGPADNAADYAAALDSTRANHQEIRSAVAAACREEADPMLAAAADASPLDLIVTPAFGADIEVTALPFPHAAWQQGDRRFACVLRQEEPRALRYADFQTPDLDPALRICQDAELVTVACDEPHTREQLLVMTATPAVAAGDLPGRKAVKEDDGGTWVKLRDEVYEQLDAECAAYFTLIAHDPDEGLSPVAELYPEGWGDDDGEFSAVCTISSPLGVAAADMLETSRSVVG